MAGVVAGGAQGVLVYPGVYQQTFADGAGGVVGKPGGINNKVGRTSGAFEEGRGSGGRIFRERTAREIPPVLLARLGETAYLRRFAAGSEEETNTIWRSDFHELKHVDNEKKPAQAGSSMASGVAWCRQNCRRFAPPGTPSCKGQWSMNLFNSLLSMLSGKERQVDNLVRGRQPGKLTPDEYNQVYQHACDLITPHMPLHENMRQAATSKWSERQVKRGIALLEYLLKGDPQNWAIHWIIGKGFQALHDSRSACDAFAKSFAIQKQNADVAREYMFECLNLGRAKEGVFAAEHAIALEPNNAGLRANLALAQLIAGDLEAAAHGVNQALAIDAGDSITRNLQRTIAEVRSGRRRQPTRLGEL